MAQLYGLVDQVSPGVGEEGKWEELHLNRDFALQTNTREGLVDKWTREGRVFIGTTPVQGVAETMSAAGTAIVLTDPSLRFTVPSGLVVVPISVQISGHHTTAKHAIFQVLATASDSFTSGGDAVAMPVTNALINSTTQARSSNVVKVHYSDTAIVEAALVAPRCLKSYLKNATATDPTDWVPEYNILKGDPMVYMIGPASFLVYVLEETAALEAEWTMMWAELDPSVVP